MLLLTMALYTGLGFLLAILACFFRRQCLPGAVLGSTICGTAGAMAAGVLFGVSVGPMVAGISVLPSLIGATIAVVGYEMLARHLFVKPESVIVAFPDKKGAVQRKAA
jgi:uncharacterized membrane protein YeaQ/YmgE (transglycosylase-associated protein family)